MAEPYWGTHVIPLGSSFMSGSGTNWSHSHTYTSIDDNPAWDAQARQIMKQQQDQKYKERKQMDAVAAVRAEREKVRIEQSLDEYEASWLVKGGYDAGTVIRFDIKFDHKDEPYMYAAIYAPSDRWYVTGSSAPQRLTTRQLIDWLIGCKVAVDDIHYNTAPSDG